MTHQILKEIQRYIFIYVPTEVARDGTVPFKEGDKVEVEIKGKTR